MTNPTLHVVQSGGATLIKYAPTFSVDGTVLLCACAAEIKVFSTETGECIQRLLGHEADITGIAHHPQIKLQIVSASLDGTVKTWDYEDGVLLKSCTIGCPVVGLFSFAVIKENIFLITKEKEEANLMKMSLESMNAGRGKQCKDLILLAASIIYKMPKSVDFLLSGRYLVFCKKQKLCVQGIVDSLNDYIEHDSKSDGRITCISCHPTEDCCVTGHSSGKIKFWHNICPKKGKSGQKVISTQHWHVSKVQDVCFTPGGANLLSIGFESVLVQWHFREHGNKKDFLPRLGAPARHIVTSPNGMLYASSHLDNSLLLITNYFTIKHALEGFTAAVKDKSDNLKVGFLEYDWKTESCVTTGKPGHLLFYKPYTDTQLYNLDITHENYIAADHSSTISLSVITNVAFSWQKSSPAKNDPCNFTWMATVEGPDDVVVSQERKLKFWVFDEEKQWWKLNTIVNNPHKSTVSRITFRPQSGGVVSDPALLSTGLDGVAKLWSIRESGAKQTSIFWSCAAVASYRKEHARHGDFSQDGSLVAIAFGHAICLCDPEEFEDLSVFVSFAKEESINQLMFGRHSSQHMLMVILNSSMQACDLLTGTTIWSVSIKVTHVIRDPLSDTMAAFCDTKDLYVFKPTDASLTYVHKNVCENSILSAAFVPNGNAEERSWMTRSSDVPWIRHSHIFFVDCEMSVFVVCTDEEFQRKQNLSKAVKTIASNAESLQTPLASVLQGSSTKDVSGTEDKRDTDTTHQEQLTALKKIVDTPPHILPRLSLLSKDFILAHLPKKVQKVSESHRGNKEVIFENEKSDDDATMKLNPLEEKLKKIDLNTIHSRHYDFFDDLFQKK